MKKILITGANGQLTNCIKELISHENEKDYLFIFKSKEQLDITNASVIEDYFFSNQFHAVINCAAYTAVDNAESDVENAFKVNADGVLYLAKECYEQDALFIHISTDYVFDGQTKTPYLENHITNPQNVYGKSKLKGEELALEHNPNSIIIRTAWVYSQYGKNFLKTMLYLFNEKEEINVVNDQYGTPTNANDLARAILTILEAKNKVPGIYHFTNVGETTWYEFAQEIKTQTHCNIKINPVPSSAYPTPAKRPNYSVLDTHKIINTYHVNCPNWKEGVKEVLSKMKL